MKVNKKVSDKASKELTRQILAAKILIDLLIFVFIITIAPLIIVFLINNQEKIEGKYPIIKNISGLPYDYFYIFSGIASILIITWHIGTKGSIKNINDAILTFITVIAALKIFSHDDNSISQVVISLTSNQGFLFFCKQLIVICGLAKIGISLFEFAKDRVKYFKSKLDNVE